MKGAAAASQEALEEFLHAAGSGDAFLHFDDFARSELLPARADGSAVTEAVEEEFCFAKGEAHLTGEADEQKAIESADGIAALAANAIRGGQEARLFVIADGRGIKAGAGGELPDLHLSPSKKRA